MMSLMRLLRAPTVRNQPQSRRMGQGDGVLFGITLTGTVRELAGQSPSAHGWLVTMPEDRADLSAATSHCLNCGEEYSDPNGIASDEYMWQGHVMFDCPDPDQMFKAWLNASPVERREVWP